MKVIRGGVRLQIIAAVALNLSLNILTVGCQDFGLKVSDNRRRRSCLRKLWQNVKKIPKKMYFLVVFLKNDLGGMLFILYFI